MAKQTNWFRGIVAKVFALVVGSVFSVSSALAANFLVFGDYGSAQGNLTTVLTGLGNTVTNTGAMPASFAGYNAVWDLQIFGALTPSQEAQMIAYIQGGGSVYFTGERPCCDAANGSIQNILRAVVAGGGTIQVGNLGDIGGPYTFNAAALSGISTTPNTLTTWTPSASGGMANIPAANIFATGTGATTVGAVYGPGNMTTGVGRAVVLMDVNYLDTDPARAQIVANIANFLQFGSGGAPVVPVLVPTLSDSMLFGLALLLLGAAVWARRRVS
jgi:hypothetical protein